jgi:serine/threonine-protein kinase RsbW
MCNTAATVFERRFPNAPDELNRVTMEAVGFVESSGIEPQAVYMTNLAIEEMTTNILKYGYDDSAAHEILLRLEVKPDLLVMTLEDDGHPFNPLDVPEPDVNQAEEDRIPGGLGIFLVRKLARRMDYERRENRNRLVIEISRKETALQ